MYEVVYESEKFLWTGNRVLQEQGRSEEGRLNEY